jgi:hypothetical protein
LSTETSVFTETKVLEEPMPNSSTSDHDRRWLILAVLGVAQLMVVLDATVVNIALPSAQKRCTSPTAAANGW